MHTLFFIDSESRMSKFAFHSEQVHSTYENGQLKMKKNIVNIENGKGTKTVTLEQNGTSRTSTKKLKPAEIRKIHSNQFIPGLFKPCIDCINGSRSKGASRSKTQKKKGSK